MDIFELRRQTVHAAGIVTIVPLLLWGKWAGAVFTGTVLAVFIIWALWREKRQGRARGINKFVESFATGYERFGERPLMGAITLLTGATIAVVAFSEPIAAAAIAVLALGDAASTVVGVYLGKHKLPVNPQKSWEGSFALLLSSFVVLLLFVNPLRAFLTAFMAMAIEALPRVDDNISIPVTVGVLLTAMDYFNI